MRRQFFEAATTMLARSMQTERQRLPFLLVTFVVDADDLVDGGQTPEALLARNPADVVDLSSRISAGSVSGLGCEIPSSQRRFHLGADGRN